MIKFRVLQVDSEKEAKARENGLSYKFTSLDVHKQMGTKPEREMYNCIFEGYTIVENESKYLELCEIIYKDSNLHHIEGWKGHSMSVSDIIEIEGNFYYCDDIGFVKLEDF